jgi:hypothetical protein
MRFVNIQALELIEKLDHLLGGSSLGVGGLVAVEIHPACWETVCGNDGEKQFILNTVGGGVIVKKSGAI